MKLYLPKGARHLFRYIPILILLVISVISNAQNSPTSEAQLKQEAAKYFEQEDYADAYPLYSQLLSLYPQDATYNYRVGACMLFTKADKEKPVDYLELAIRQPKVDNIAYYYLARAYHLNYKFDAAIRTYQHFQQIASSSELKKHPVSRLIDMCNNGKTLLNSNVQELDVLVKKELNVADYFQAYDLSVNGGSVLVEPDDFKSKLDKKKNFSSIIYLSADKSQVFYASYGDDDKNGTDIYVVKRLPTGGFSKPTNLGTIINSPEDEDYPFYDEPTHTLYFSSKGHNSMGGFDVFRSVYNANNDTWSSPVNMDFPINTPDDDILFIADTLNQTAFFASTRFSPKGSIDIYKIKMQPHRPEYVQIRGTSYADAGKTVIASKITVTDFKNNQVAGVYNSSPDNGGYLLNLANAGKFIFTVETPGHKTQSKPVILPSEESLATLGQTIGYDATTDTLIITNNFQTAGSDSDYLLALNYIKDKAQMEVHIDSTLSQQNATQVQSSNNNNNAVAQNTTNNTTQTQNTDNSQQNSTDNNNASNSNNTTNNTSTTQTASNNNSSNSVKNNSTDQLVQNEINDAKSNAQQDQQAAKDLTDDANKATEYANAKIQEAQDLQHQAQQITDNANTITDPKQKSDSLAKASALKQQANDLSKKAIEAFELASQDQNQASAKRQQADQALAYSDKLDSAERTSSNNKDAAILKIQAQQDSIRKVQENTTPVVANTTPGDLIRQQAFNTKQDSTEVAKHTDDLKKELPRLDQESQDYIDQAQKTDNAQEKVALLQQAKDLADSKKEKQKEIQDNAKLQQQLHDQYVSEVSEAKVADSITQSNNSETTSPQVAVNDASLKNEIANYNPTANNNSNSQSSNNNTTSSTNNSNNISGTNNSQNSTQQNNNTASTNNPNNTTATNTNPDNNQSSNQQNNTVASNNTTTQNTQSNNQNNTTDNGQNTQNNNTTASNNSTNNTTSNNNQNNTVTNNNTTGNNTTDNGQNTQNNNTTASNNQNNTTSNNNQNNTSGTNNTSNTATDNNQQNNTTANTNTSNTGTQTTGQNIVSGSQPNVTSQQQVSQTSAVYNTTPTTNYSSTSGINTVIPTTTVQYSSPDATTASNNATALSTDATNLTTQATDTRKQARTTTDPQQAKLLYQKADSLDNAATQKNLESSEYTQKANTGQYQANRQKINVWQNQLKGNPSDAITTANLLVQDANFFYAKSEAEKLKADSTTKPYLKQTYLDNSKQYIATALLKQQNAENIYLSVDKNLPNVTASNNTLTASSLQNNNTNQTNNSTDNSTTLGSNTNSSQNNTTNSTQNTSSNNPNDNNTTTLGTNNNQVANNNTSTQNTANNSTQNSSNTNPNDNNTTNLGTNNNQVANNNTSSQNTTNNSTQNSSNNNPTNNNTTTLGTNNTQVANNNTSTQNNITTSTDNNTTTLGTNNNQVANNNNTSTQNTTTNSTQNSSNNNTTDNNTTTLGTNNNQIANNSNATNTQNTQSNTANNNSTQEAHRIDSMLSAGNNTAANNNTTSNTGTQSNNNTTAQNNNSNQNSGTNNTSNNNATNQNSTSNNTTVANNNSTDNNTNTAQNNSTQNNSNNANTSQNSNNNASTNNSQNNSTNNSGNNNTASTQNNTSGSNTDNTNNNSQGNNTIASTNNASQNNSTQNNNTTGVSNNTTSANNTQANNNTSGTNNTSSTQEAHRIDSMLSAGNNTTSSNNANNNTNSQSNNNTTAQNNNTQNNSTNNTANNSNSNNVANNNTSVANNNTSTDNTNNSSTHNTVEMFASDEFQETSSSPYSAAKPIPINPPLPEGLVYKVQIGAFRNSIPQNLFKGIQPVTGERTATGLTRYTAGLFKEFNGAKSAQDKIHALGFRDAFIVAFLNGKRIPLPQAIASQGGNANTVAVNNTTPDNTSQQQTNNTTVQVQNPVNSTSVKDIKGVFYSVQIGAFQHQVTAAQLYNLSPLFSYNAPNGYIRYNCGKYDNITKASAEKQSIIARTPIKDAFVVAYSDGERIGLPQAAQLLGNSQPAPTNPTPSPAPTTNPEPTPVTTTPTVTTTPPVTNPTPTPTPITSTPRDTTPTTPTPTTTTPVTTPPPVTNPTPTPAPVTPAPLPANWVTNRTLSSYTVEPAGDVTVSISIRRGAISGFAKVEDVVPEGFTVAEGEKQGASFRFENGKVQWVWLSLPSDTVFTVTYKLTALSTVSGQQTITGRFLYTENNEKQETPIAPTTLTVGGSGGSTNPVTNPTPTPNPTALSTSDTSKKVSFCVQVGSFSGPIPIDMANKLLTISNQGIHAHKEDNGITSYTIGDYPDFTSANELKKELVKDGYTSSFVVAYCQGNKISLEKAQALGNK